MNKKGLTLLELLAVIVVLAIIALIATPIVIRTINDSKNNATLRGAENYIREIEYSVAQGILNKIKLEDGTYQIMKSGNICLGIYEENAFFACFTSSFLSAKNKTLPIIWLRVITSTTDAAVLVFPVPVAITSKHFLIPFS